MSGAGAGRVGIVVGSRSDIAAAEKAAAVLDELGVASETRVISAHRAPDLLAGFVSGAETRGIRVFIAIAGLAAPQRLPATLTAQGANPRAVEPLPNHPPHEPRAPHAPPRRARLGAEAAG